MARHEGKIEASQGLTEILAALGRRSGEQPDRGQAIACYLSAGDGWRDASRLLGGAFAGRSGTAGKDCE